MYWNGCVRATFTLYFCPRYFYDREIPLPMRGNAQEMQVLAGRLCDVAILRLRSSLLERIFF